MNINETNQQPTTGNTACVCWACWAK